MPIGPEFNSGETPIAGPSVAGSVSLMQRAAQSRLDQQQLAQEIEQKRQQWEIQRPVFQAQQQASLVTGAANLVLQKQAADFVAQQTNSLPALQKEWQDISTIPDVKERTDRQHEFMNRVAPISMLPAGEMLYKNLAHEFDKTQQMQYQNDIVAQKTMADQLRAANEDAKRRLDQAALDSKNQATLHEQDLKQAKIDADIRVQAAHDAQRADAAKINADAKAKAASDKQAGVMSLEDALAAAKEKKAANPEYDFIPQPKDASPDGSSAGYILKPKLAGDENLTPAERNRQQRIADSATDVIRKAKVAYQMLAQNGGATGMTGEVNQYLLSPIGLASQQNATRDVLRSLRAAYEAHLRNFGSGNSAGSGAAMKEAVAQNTPQTGFGFELQDRGLEKLQGLVSTLMLEAQGAANRIGKKSMFNLTLPDITAMRNTGLITNEQAKGWVDWANPPQAELDAEVEKQKQRGR